MEPSAPIMSDSKDNPPAVAARPLGMVRNASMPVFNTDTSNQLPPMRERLSSLDSTWIRRSASRFSIGSTDEISIGSTEELQTSMEAIANNTISNARKPDNKLPTHPTNKGMGPRKKSESAIWKWFNTPMNSEAQHNIRGFAITEEHSDFKLPNSDQGDGFVYKKKFSAMKDLNVLSPQHW